MMEGPSTSPRSASAGRKLDNAVQLRVVWDRVLVHESKLGWWNGTSVTIDRAMDSQPSQV
jgi:hypothetical protein